MTTTNTSSVASAVRHAAVMVNLNLLWPELQVRDATLAVFEGEAGNFESVVVVSLVVMLGTLGIGSLLGLVARLPLVFPLSTTRFAILLQLFERFLGIAEP